MIFRLSLAGTPAWKLGLIPVLGTVLFKVTRPADSGAQLPDAPARVETVSAPKVETMRSIAVLPKLSLDDALKFNPFGSLPLAERRRDEAPAEVEAPEPEAGQPLQPSTPPVNPLVEKAAALKQLKVSAVFSSANGSVAIIDSKTVRAGDLLSPGVRVVEIRGTDVILRVEDGEAAPGAATGGAELR
jgi:hypothetical protein